MRFLLAQIDLLHAVNYREGKLKGNCVCITHLDGCLEVLRHFPEVHVVAFDAHELVNATIGAATLLCAGKAKRQHRIEGGCEQDDVAGTWAAQLHAEEREESRRIAILISEEAEKGKEKEGDNYAPLVVVLAAINRFIFVAPPNCLTNK